MGGTPPSGTASAAKGTEPADDSAAESSPAKAQGTAAEVAAPPASAGQVVLFDVAPLQAELDALKADLPIYASNVGTLTVPKLVCDDEGQLVAPPAGEGPWDLTVWVQGGEAGDLASLTETAAELAKAKEQAKQETTEARKAVEEAEHALEEAKSKDAETSTDVLAQAEEAAKARLVEAKEAEERAAAEAKSADKAKARARAAEAYNLPYQLGLRFDTDWPEQPPTVRFQGVIHHALIDDSGGMLLPFYKTLPREDSKDEPGKKVFTIRSILSAVHQFLIDPLQSWGIPAESAPNRLIQSILANQQMNEQRLSTIRKYSKMVKHRELFASPATWRDEWFDPDFLRASRENTEEAWRSILKEHVPDKVFSCKMLTDAFCDTLVEEIFNFYASGLPARRPNSMNNYGIIINEIGLEPLVEQLQRILQPLGQIFFPGPGSAWDGQHCFIVRYREGEDLGLDMHTDDSDVTFNICLGIDFDGAGLQFCGMMGAGNHRRHCYTYKHVKGSCIFHLGRQRHGADDITHGERLNLIVWNHSSTYRASDEYKQPDYNVEEGPPDDICVSYTHDRDYGIFKEYPKGKENHKGRGWCPPKEFEYLDFKPDSDQVAQMG